MQAVKPMLMCNCARQHKKLDVLDHSDKQDAVKFSCIDAN